jgi:quinol monooxygenase YgiN
MFVMLVSIRVNPAFLDAFIDITRYNARASRAEPGVVRFDFFQDRDHPDTFKLLEIYRQEEDRQEHYLTPHFLLWKKTVAPWMVGERTREFLTNLYPADEEWG